MAGMLVLAAGALLALGGVAQAAITTTAVTSPKAPFFPTPIYNADTGAVNAQFVISGTSDGTTGDRVDVLCYYQGTNAGVFDDNGKLGIPVNADGSWATAAKDMGSTYDENCLFRAVPHGTTPSDLSSYAGLKSAVSYVSTSKITAGPNAGKLYGFFTDMWHFAAHSEIESLGECGVSSQYPVQNLANSSAGWDCAGALYEKDVSNPSLPSIAVGGTPAFNSAAARGAYNEKAGTSEEAAGFPGLSFAGATDPSTGEGNFTEEEDLVRCSGAGFPPTFATCPAFAPTGVHFRRTAQTAREGGVLLFTDTYTSTDGASHPIDLRYDNYLSASRPVFTWPGRIGPETFNQGDIVEGTFPAPGSVTGGSGEDLISLEHPAASMTWDTAPTRVRYSSSEEFSADYLSRTVPASGALTLRFAFVSAGNAEQLAANRGYGEDRLGVPSVFISSPVNGSTTSSSKVNVTGKATDNVGVSSLTVNGSPVAVGPGGGFVASVTLAAGTNTITALASDATGNTAQAQAAVTFKAPPKCKVPSLRGKSLKAAGKALRKAHCKLGKVSKKPRRGVRGGRVSGQSIKAGKVVGQGTTINLTVAPRRSHK
jgi:hypothetical protein